MIMGVPYDAEIAYLELNGVRVDIPSGMIPVRVGSGTNAVGYIYDRATRKLIGATGGSTFVLGPDVARPVMGLRRYKPTARNYVQDGLVAMWDGIENAGWGVHDKNAKSWVDLVGGVKLVPYSTLRWLGDSPAFVAWMRNTSIFLDTTYGFTIESCISKHSDGQLGLWQASSLAIGSTSSGYMTTKALGAGPSSSWNGDGPTAIGREWGAAQSLARLTTRCYSNDEVNMYFSLNANQSIYTLPNYYPASGAHWFDIGGGAGSIEYSGVHCIRLYSRALTADEIAANYAIDKIRFNLP